MLNEFVCVESKKAKMQYSIDVISKFLETGIREKYYCPVCGEEMIFKNCTEKEKHFSHKADTRCNYGKGGESEEHKIAKRFLSENIGEMFTINGNKIIGSGNTFVLGGSQKVVVKEIHIEKSLKEILGLKRNYIPDVYIEAVTGEIIALEIYNTHAKSDEDIENLKGKDLIVYEIDIKQLEKLTMQEIYKNMNLIYSLNKMGFEGSLRHIRDEYKKIKSSLNYCKEKLITVEAEKEKLDIKNIKLTYENRKLSEEKDCLIKGNKVCIDGFIKEVFKYSDTICLVVGNSKKGKIILYNEDTKYFDFFKDMEGTFGGIIWNNAHELKSFRFKSNMLQNKNHFLFQKGTMDYVKKDGYKYGALFYKGVEVSDWESFRENI